jgi:hypothetical protein
MHLKMGQCERISLGRGPDGKCLAPSPTREDNIKKNFIEIECGTDSLPKSNLQKIIFFFFFFYNNWLLYSLCVLRSGPW